MFSPLSLLTVAGVSAYLLGKGWGKVLSTFAAIFHFILFPIGTVLGVLLLKNMASESSKVPKID